MKDIVKNRCDLLIANKNSIEKEFKWGEPMMNIASGLVFSGAGKQADIERLKECKTILEKNIGYFSSLRSTAAPIVVSKMAMANDPIQYLNDVKMVYDKVSKGMFSDGSYMVQAAISICDQDKVLYADNYVAKFKELYKKMGKIHPFLTSSEDIVFAVLLVMTDKSVDTIINEMEECYNYLRKELKIKVGANEIQGVSEVLTLTDGDWKEKCDKVVKLYETFLAHGVKYGTEYNEFASLGALIELDVDIDEFVDEVVETEAYLKIVKGFGDWTMNKKQRLMFAAMLVGDAYSADGSITSSSAIASSVAAIIAEEVAIMICCMAAVSAATTVTN